MAKKPPTAVDTWLTRETDHVRKALENASKHFDGNDNLTVNTLEAIYAKESSFGNKLGTHGSSAAAGHFQLRPDTAKRYGLSISKKNDQRFNIDYASSATARYLKDLNTFFGKATTLAKGLATTPVVDTAERKRFVLAAYNAGEGRIAKAQSLATMVGKDPQSWNDVEEFLEQAGANESVADDAREYVEKVPAYESEFATKSDADKNIKQKNPKKETDRCTDGHWVTIEDRHVFICD